MGAKGSGRAEDGGGLPVRRPGPLFSRGRWCATLHHHSAVVDAIVLAQGHLIQAGPHAEDVHPGVFAAHVQLLSAHQAAAVVVDAQHQIPFVPQGGGHLDAEGSLIGIGIDEQVVALWGAWIVHAGVRRPPPPSDGQGGLPRTRPHEPLLSRSASGRTTKPHALVTKPAPLGPILQR